MGRMALLVLIFFTGATFAQEARHKLRMGDSLVTFVVENPKSKSRVLFLNVHENEATSMQAVRAYDVNRQFRFVYLHHNRTRRISFNHNGVVYSVDPNRIFSRPGIVATIAYDTLSSRKAEKISKHLADRVLKYVYGASWVISLHNNTPGNYSILSYLPGQAEAPNAADVFVNEARDPDDFIYTTNSDLFQKLKAAGINAILQDNANCIDDGSLSVWCGKRGVPYANVEAEESHLEEQVELIRAVMDAIR